MTATPEAIQTTVHAYVAAYRANDRAACLSLYADDCDWTDPVGTPTHHGQAGVGEFWDTARTMAESIILEHKSTTICGNEAAVCIEIHVVIGGATMIMDAIDIFEFDDNAKIKSGKAYWDMAKARTS